MVAAAAVASAAAAAAAAAAAVAATAAMVAAAAARRRDSVSTLATGRDKKAATMISRRGDNGGPDSVVVRRTIVFFVRWALSGAWRREKAELRSGESGSNSSPQSDVSPGVPAKVLRRWWVGTGLAWLVAKSFGGGIGRRGGMSGGTGNTPRTRSQGVSIGGSAFIPTTQVPSLAGQYPRPQSTAYPRPQSTAYPRPKVSVPTLLNLEDDVDAEPVPIKQRTTTANGKGRSDDSNPLLSRFLCWFFARVITKRARLVEGLEVRVDARSNRDAMSGLLQAVGITFNHLELQNLQISAGATVRITGLDLKVMTLLWRRFNSFKKPFEVAGSYVFTSSDLVASPIVRRLVQNMMNATLRKLEVRDPNAAFFGGLERVKKTEF